MHKTTFNCAFNKKKKEGKTNNINNFQSNIKRIKPFVCESICCVFSFLMVQQWLLFVCSLSIFYGSLCVYVCLCVSFFFLLHLDNLWFLAVSCYLIIFCLPLFIFSSSSSWQSSSSLSTQTHFMIVVIHNRMLTDLKY